MADRTKCKTRMHQKINCEIVDCSKGLESIESFFVQISAALEKFNGLLHHLSMK